MREADLYPPIKAFLERQGYTVKGEVGPCDVAAVRNDEPPVIVELKTAVNLQVVLQAVDRLSLSPNVYIGVPGTSAALKRQRSRVVKLLRRLGVGLLVVSQRNKVTALLDPTEYMPRISRHRTQRLLGEFEKRVGDPNDGGIQTRGGRMTAYRQRALRLAEYLSREGPTRAAELAEALDDSGARDVLYRNVYGWFDRPGRGVYTLSPRGERELPGWLARNGGEAGGDAC